MLVMGFLVLVKDGVPIMEVEHVVEAVSLSTLVTAASLLVVVVCGYRDETELVDTSTKVLLPCTT